MQKEKEEKEEWEKEGKITEDDGYVEGKKIKNRRGGLIIAEKDIKDIATKEGAKNMIRRFDEDDEYRYFIEDRIDYKKYDASNNLVYDVKFEKNVKKDIIGDMENTNDYKKVFINGVRVRKNKIQFLLRRITPETTQEDIKKMNNLSQMQMEFLNLKEIRIDRKGGDIELSVNVDLAGKDEFKENKYKINILNKNKIIFCAALWNRDSSHNPLLREL